jgi:hypothetical protein
MARCPSVREKARAILICTQRTEADMTKMPQTVRVGVYTYRVTEDGTEWARYVNDGTGKDRAGFSDHNTLVIAINPGLAPDQKAETLIHEVLHAAWWIGSVGSLEALKDDADVEEFVVSHLSPWLLMTLRDNPELVEYLREPD